MSHHEDDLPYTESVAAVDSRLAQQVSQWKRELTTEQYKERIRELMDDLDDARDWIGKEGDDATRLHTLTKEHYESL